MTDEQRIVRVENAYKRAVLLVMNDFRLLPEGVMHSFTPMVLGLVDRMLSPDYPSHLTAAGVEAMTRSEVEQ